MTTWVRLVCAAGILLALCAQALPAQKKTHHAAAAKPAAADQAPVAPVATPATPAASAVNQLEKLSAQLKQKNAPAAYTALS